ncbi:MAG: exodeoxyribonuclease VII large subunit [Phototrophicales bacterium]|nr:MAG: exodeoxyribonuclease VII large subunit [Phototrophicales bacterium]
MQNLPLFFDEDFDPEEDHFPMQAPTGPLSVSELTAYIKKQFDSDPQLQKITVEGEIGTFSRAPSGHLYFTLKDDNAQLKAVMWRSQAEYLSFTPRQGDLVHAKGYVSVYEPRGEYQLYATSLRPAGVGDLHARFEHLKAQLAQEGLFDAERKRPLPFFPRKIGIVTSLKAAALQDVLNVLQRRFPVAEVIISPTMVQGEEAPPRIIAALKRFYQRQDIDVILLVRGGGSIEDLWAFNDENVVRTVAASPVPIVTGVGHEIDFTLVDFASDYRAPTPSAAAEVVVPEADILRLNVDSLEQRLYTLMHSHLAEMRQRLLNQERTLRLLSPQRQVEYLRQQVNMLSKRLERQILGYITNAKSQLAHQQARIESLNPRAILARGYAVVRRASDNQQITSSVDVESGTQITIQFHDGNVSAKVE